MSNFESAEIKIYANEKLEGSKVMMPVYDIAIQ